jgi:HNH endonuclease/Helix-turn-helix domain
VSEKPVPVLYLDLDGYPDYFAGSDGHVYSLRTLRRWGKAGQPRQLKEHRSASGHGYPFVTLYDSAGNPKQHSVHTLICTAFHGLPPDGCECSHLNDVKTDNAPGNLCWETSAGNKARKLLNGIVDSGVRNSRSVLTVEKLRAVRRMLAEGMTTYAIARHFGVSRTVISRVKNGHRYVHDGREAQG